MTDDLPLFGWSPPAPSSPKPIDQAVELARVLSAIERHIMAFLRERIQKPDRSFHMTTLLEFVNARRGAEGKKPCAPDSPRRVMRELGAQGCCDVRLLDRSLSLYEVVAVSED
jgi:hypothetical protein